MSTKKRNASRRTARRLTAGHKHQPDDTVDLDQEVRYDQQGRRITEQDVADDIADLESDDVQLDESRAVFPQRGRPSLSGRSKHSPRMEFRVSDSVKVRVGRLAREQGRNESEIAREALEQYLARH